MRKRLPNLGNSLLLQKELLILRRETRFKEMSTITILREGKMRTLVVLKKPLERFF
jgi:hypothetical protein